MINYPQDGAGVFTAPDDVELFKTWKVQEHVKKIDEIKDNPVLNVKYLKTFKKVN